MEFLSDLGLFAAKSIFIVVCIVLVLVAIASVFSRKGVEPDTDIGRLFIRHMNEFYQDLRRAVDIEVSDPKLIMKAHKADAKARRAQDKKIAKAAKKQKKDEQPADAETKKRTVYVLDFKGDVEASKVEDLRREITAVLLRTERPDEVVVRVESAGGFVHSYGFAASQLSRIKDAGVKLTVAVDRVAASGGYMMAVVADAIIAAPFAVVGSIGVAAEIPNLHRLLQKYDVDYDVITAGQYKRTMTVLGENTDAGREKFTQEVEETHALFSDFVGSHRSDVDLAEIATGESWYGQRALNLKLVDHLQTSDDYIMKACDDAEVYEVEWIAPRQSIGRLAARFSAKVTNVINQLLGGIR